MQMNAIIYGHLDMQKKQNEFDKLGIQNYLRRTFGMFKGDRQRVTMSFENGLLDAVVDRLGTENILYYPDDKKHFSVNAEIEVSPQFFAWVIGFGDKARIAAFGF